MSQSDLQDVTRQSNSLDFKLNELPHVDCRKFEDPREEIGNSELDATNL